MSTYRGKNSFTRHTWELLQSGGWECVSTEYQTGLKTFDFLGFADILATMDGVHMLVQSTSLEEHNRRRNKILVDCRKEALQWLRGGGLIQIISWDVQRDLEKSEEHWTPRMEQLIRANFPSIESIAKKLKKGIK